MKSRDFLYYTSWLKHFREIPSRRKRSYLSKFSRRFPKISCYLMYIKILRSTNQLPELIKQVNPAVILIDNKLYSMVKGLDTQVVPEKNVRYKHHRRLMLIADNLANYFRILIKDNPKRFKEELRKFEKLK